MFEDPIRSFFPVIHGYASFIANNGMNYDPATIERSLTSLAEAIIVKDEQ